MKNFMSRFSIVSLITMPLFIFVLYPHWFNTGFSPYSMTYSAYLSGDYMAINPFWLRVKIVLFSVLYASVFIAVGMNRLETFLNRYRMSSLTRAIMMAMFWFAIALLVELSLGGLVIHMPIHLDDDSWFQFGLFGTSIALSLWLAWVLGSKLYEH